MIYFDNSATTKMSKEALLTYMQVNERIFGNPSSLHSLGDQSEALLSHARKQIADLLKVQSSEIYFTSGGTEGDNWVLKGTAIEKRQFGKHLITTRVEHPAVKNTMDQLIDIGFEVSFLSVDEFGRVNPEELKTTLRSDTILVSIMAVNNEIGTIQPIEEISEILTVYPKVHFHVDAVQAIGKVPMDKWLTPRVDFASFSAHKFHGPKGVGFIYWKNGKRIAPLLNGGGQEGDQRSGTENIGGISATAKALRLLLTDERNKIEKQQHILDYLSDSLSQYKDVTIFSQKNTDFAPHILCFALKGIRGEVMVHAFEKKTIFISTTSACSSRKKLPGGTLLAMNVPESLATSAVRISLDEHSTMAEAEQFMIIFKQLYERFQQMN